MNIAAITSLTLYGLVLVVWLARRAFVAQLGRQIPQLHRRNVSGDAKQLPLVSVLIPAKDEENTIGPCLRSVLAQTHTNLEVLVIDDRSQDGTVAVVRNIARLDPRVRLLQTRELPAGWTGKTYALWLGAAEARGNWFWFLDADTCHVPENLAVVLDYARRHHSDLVTLLPALESRTFWERVVQPLAAVLLMKLHDLRSSSGPRDAVRWAGAKWRPHRAHVASASPHGNGAAVAREASEGFANGQYILIRRRVYRAIGGHRRVRDRFLEDVELGRRARANGFRIDVAFGKELTQARMYHGGKALVQGWSRILYGTAHNRPARLAVTGIGIWVFSCSAFLVLIVCLAAWPRNAALPVSPALQAAAAMNLAHFALMLSTMAKLYNLVGSPRRWLAFYPLACLAMSWILLRALWMCFTHRVTWRGRLYRRAGHKAHPCPRQSSTLLHRHGAAVTEE